MQFFNDSTCQTMTINRTYGSQNCQRFPSPDGSQVFYTKFDYDNPLPPKGALNPPICKLHSYRVYKDSSCAAAIEADEDTANLTRWSIDQALYTEDCRESATPGVFEQILCDDETSISVQYFLDKQCTLEIKKKQIINSDTCSYLLGADDLPRGPLKFFIGDPEKPLNDSEG